MDLKIVRAILIVSIIPSTLFLLSIGASFFISPNYIHSIVGLFMVFSAIAVILLLPILSIILIFLKKKMGLYLAILYGILSLFLYGPAAWPLITRDYGISTLTTTVILFSTLSIITIILSILLLKKE